MKKNQHEEGRGEQERRRARRSFAPVEGDEGEGGARLEAELVEFDELVGRSLVELTEGSAGLTERIFAASVKRLRRGDGVGVGGEAMEERRLLLAEDQDGPSLLTARPRSSLWAFAAMAAMVITATVLVVRFSIQVVKPGLAPGGPGTVALSKEAQDLIAELRLVDDAWRSTDAVLGTDLDRETTALADRVARTGIESAGLSGVLEDSWALDQSIEELDYSTAILWGQINAF